MQSMNLGRGRGRPHKELVEPSMEGFPEDDTADKKQKRLKMKATDIWQYMLTSEQAQEYRQRENARVQEYHRKKKAQAAGQAPSPSPCHS